MDPSCILSMVQAHDGGVTVLGISWYILTPLVPVERDPVRLIWTKISEDYFQHLVYSMPQRIKAVLKAKWGATLVHQEGIPKTVVLEGIFWEIILVSFST
ncbi:hypothetical protein ILYODFUR_035608 [Ilyodon furcidens]|uniref:Uncharacterized protein n=1 Tax=Ilyodon furcidens TaxID=33524 RepID=A0ABV0UF86_9TELE